MANENQSRIDLADAIHSDLAIENRLSASQARAFVRGLQTTWQVPTINWSETESIQQLEDARRLLHAAEIYSTSLGLNNIKSKDCYKRAGEILEWLSRAKDNTQTIAPIELLAGAAFQLGGLPAMASGLLGQLELINPGHRLYANFFKADFDSVLNEISEFWNINPHLTTDSGSNELLLEDSEDAIEWYFTVEIVRCIGLIADSLRTGKNDRLENAIQKLVALDKIATRTFSPDVSLLISLLRCVAVNFQTCSIYHPIRALISSSTVRPDRLEHYARGQFSRGRGILWESQLQGLSRLLQSSSFALCTPTGSGKTLVANLAIVKELLLSELNQIAPLCLYLVPSRALAGEVEAKLQSELGSDLIITGLYGGSDWGITDYWLNAARPTVLIATIEKADALMRYLGPIILTRLKLLIIDEAHQVVPEDNTKSRDDMAEHSNRSIRLESFVSRLLAISPEVSRIALTAVAGGASTPVARWIEKLGEAQAIGSRYRSTRQVIGTLQSTPNFATQISIDVMNGLPLYVRGRDEPVFIPLRTPIMPQLPRNMRSSINKFNAISVLWTALHLVEAHRRILISVAQTPERLMNWFKDALELPEWGNASNFQLPEDAECRELFNEARACCIDYCGEDAFEVALLDHGIATSHGQMPQRLRRLMVALIDRRICPITLATATLTEGVNLPFDLIFITSLKRSSFDQVTNRPIEIPISVSEFKNLSGRAGRPGSSNSIEGMTLIALPLRPSTTAPSEVRTQRQQIDRIESEYTQFLGELLADEVNLDEVSSPLEILLSTIAYKAKHLLGIQEESLLNWLDSIRPEEVSVNAGLGINEEHARLADCLDELDGILLSAIEEIGRISEPISEKNVEEILTRVWNSTFTKYAAIQEEWLEQAYIRRGKAIIETIYPDGAERKRLYQYGFSPFVGRAFELIANDVKEIISSAKAFGNTNAAESTKIFEMIGELLIENRGFGFKVRNSVGDQTILQNWTNVLKWWMRSPDAPLPEPINLRSWQRFVSTNLEFRLGIVIGAVVAQAWSDGAEDPLIGPSLSRWREVTGLPWFGFWAKELLRWGTLDPFVAFTLAQGLAHTRNEASERRVEFERWLTENYVDINGEDLIDPQLFLAWQQSIETTFVHTTTQQSAQATLTGTNGIKQEYNVLPIVKGESITWIDAAGYELAQSHGLNGNFNLQNSLKSDFKLQVRNNKTAVIRTF